MWGNKNEVGETSLKPTTLKADDDSIRRGGSRHPARGLPVPHQHSSKRGSESEDGSRPGPTDDAPGPRGYTRALRRPPPGDTRPAEVGEGGRGGAWRRPRPAPIIAHDSGRSSASSPCRRQLPWMGPEVSSRPVATSLYLLLPRWQRGGYFQTLPALSGHVTASFNS